MGKAANPVAVLRDALERAPSLRGPELGALLQTAHTAVESLPPGALDAGAAAELQAMWREVFAGLPATGQGPQATSAPPAQVGTTYWLAAPPTGLGHVLRLRLELLPRAARPWPASSFWSGMSASDDAQRAALDAFDRAAAWLGEPQSEPLFGWHRIVSADGSDAHDGSQVEGRSMTAPLALMLVSRWLEAPLDPSIALTGDLDAELRVTLPPRAKAGVASKVEAVRRERRCIRKVLVPRGFARKVRGVEILEVDSFEDVLRAFGLSRRPARPASLQGWRSATRETHALAESRGAEAGVILARAELLAEAWRRLERLEPDEARAAASTATARARLLAVVCEHRTHCLAHARVEATSLELDALLEARSRDVPWSVQAYARNVQASAYIDLHRFRSARRAASLALEAARRAQDAAEEARVLSTAGRIEAHAGRDEEALARFDESLAKMAVSIPWESNIARTYRIGVLGRLARFDEAWRALDEALDANASSSVTDGWHHDNALYLAFEGLKLALRQGDLDRAAALRGRCEALLQARTLAGDPASVWPLVGILQRGVELAIRRREPHAAAYAFDKLSEACSLWPGSSTDDALGRAAALLLADAHERGGADSPAWGRALTRYLDALPDGEESPLAAHRDRTRSALAGGPASAIATALRSLVAADIY